QKNRLMLARIMANPCGLLILDEPTNDLDMDTLDMLEDMIAKYTGTLLVVSHDRDFLDQTVTKILAFEGNGKIEAVIGGYQDYLAKRKGAEKPAEAGKASAKGKTTTPQSTKTGGKLNYIQSYELENIPKDIVKLEKEIAFTENQLADHELYTRDAELFDKLTRNLAQAKATLHKAEERWLELEELRLELEGE
ncbi:MAG: ABC transporter family protein, partial [Alphaproteobacteria bacterium]